MMLGLNPISYDSSRRSKRHSTHCRFSAWRALGWTGLPACATVSPLDRVDRWGESWRRCPVTAETDGFSLFAVTTSQATNESVAEADDETDSESETDEENESTTQTSETNETSTDSETDTDTSATDASDTAPTAESSNEDVPGFGIGVSVLALLLTALLGGRRLRND